MAVLLVDLAAGLAASFFVVVAFFAGAFLAAARAFVVAEVPVTDFLAAPRLDGAVVFFVVVAVFGFGLAIVFFATGFFTVEALGFSVSAFFGAAFLVVEDLGLVAAAFVVLAFDVGLTAGLIAVLVAALVVVEDLGLVADLEVGLFSLVAASVDLDLRANLTLPEGPFGRTKIPFSSPDVMALDNWVTWAAPISRLYSASTNFLIWGRETPWRWSSVLAAMHSLIISIHVG